MTGPVRGARCAVRGTNAVRGLRRAVRGKKGSGTEHRTPHTAHRSSGTAHRVPHPAYRSSGTAYRTPHTAHRFRYAAALQVALLLTGLIGCRQEMYDQPKYKPLAESKFFADRRASRQLPEGTVARGWLRANQKLYEGKEGIQLVSTLPMPLTAGLLARGRERFNIYCSPCHDRTGSGRGMVVRRGFQPPTSLHIERLRGAPVGYLFDVVTHGLGAMPDYAAQIDVADRWAIAAYVKALQLSQNAPFSDVPPEKRRELAEPLPPAPAAPVEREMGQESRNKPVVR